MTGDWPAPAAAEPVEADVALPGSKSLTNRFLVLAALANGSSRLRRPLRSRDTLLMAAGAARARRGIEDVDGDDPEAARLAGHARDPARRLARVDCGLAGTVMRFLPPVAALADGRVTFDGDAARPQTGRWRRCSTPCARSVRRIEDDGRGTLPFTVVGTGRLPRRHGHARRLGQLPVHLRAAARRRPLRRRASSSTTTASRCRASRTSR